MNKYEIIGWTNCPTDEKRKEKYEARLIKCAERFDMAVAELRERWDAEANTKNIGNFEYLDFIQERCNGLIESLVKKVPTFWNLDLGVEYSWYVDQDLHLVMTIEEPLFEGVRTVMVKFHDN